MQIAEYAGGRRRIVTHIGSAHTGAELGVLVERARELLGENAQADLDLGVEPIISRARLVALAAGAAAEDSVEGLFTTASRAGRRVSSARVSAPQVVATGSRLLFDTLARCSTTWCSTTWCSTSSPMTRSATWWGPELRPLAGLNPDPEHVLDAIEIDADGDVRGPVADLVPVPHLDHQGVR